MILQEIPTASPTVISSGARTVQTVEREVRDHTSSSFLVASTVTTQRSINPSWHRLDSGIVIPDGVSSHVETSESDTNLRLKEKAISLESLYERQAVPLPASCDLAGLIADAKKLSDGWLTNDTQGFSVPLLVRVGHLDRIASAALLLDGTPSCSDFLEKLATGSLDLASRTRSNAMDVLWELELWAILRRNSSNTELIEPPDIVVRFDGADVGIACKKRRPRATRQDVAGSKP